MSNPELKLDPCEKFHHVPADKLVHMMSFIPQFLLGLFGGNRIRNRLQEGYRTISGIDIDWHYSDSLELSGTFRNENGEKEYPIGMFMDKDDVIFVYEKGRIAIFDNDAPAGEICEIKY